MFYVTTKEKNGDLKVKLIGTHHFPDGEDTVSINEHKQWLIKEFNKPEKEIKNR